MMSKCRKMMSNVVEMSKHVYVRITGFLRVSCMHAHALPGFCVRLVRVRALPGSKFFFIGVYVRIEG